MKEHEYIVYSPDMTLHPADGIDPPEYGACVETVKATSVKEAIRISIRLPGMKEWVDDQRSDSKNPFAGLKAELPICIHGLCHCPLCPGCPDCEDVNEHS